MDNFNILQSFFCMQMYRNGTKEAIYDYDSGIRYTYQDLAIRSYRLANFLKKNLPPKSEYCFTDIKIKTKYNL